LPLNRKWEDAKGVKGLKETSKRQTAQAVGLPLNRKWEDAKGVKGLKETPKADN
jgi:hypothetical protein